MQGDLADLPEMERESGIRRSQGASWVSRAERPPLPRNKGAAGHWIPRHSTWRQYLTAPQMTRCVKVVGTRAISILALAAAALADDASVRAGGGADPWESSNGP